MLSVILIGLGVSMDAMCVSIANGLTVFQFNRKKALITALYFGAFQFLMPLLGSLLADSVREYISAFSPYISFFLLSFIGTKMIFDAREEQDSPSRKIILTHKLLLIMALVTSMDALAIGVSLAFIATKILFACLCIGAITFGICLFAGLLGNRLPVVSGKVAEILGGAILIAIGIKLLIEGVFL